MLGTPLLTIGLALLLLPQAGLSALKTPASGAPGGSRDDPLRLPPFQRLAAHLPLAKHMHSKLVRGRGVACVYVCVRARVCGALLGRRQAGAGRCCLCVGDANKHTARTLPRANPARDGMFSRLLLSRRAAPSADRSQPRGGAAGPLGAFLLTTAFHAATYAPGCRSGHALLRLLLQEREREAATHVGGHRR